MRLTKFPLGIDARLFAPFLVFLLGHAGHVRACLRGTGSGGSSSSGSASSSGTGSSSGGSGSSGSGSGTAGSGTSGGSGSAASGSGSGSTGGGSGGASTIGDVLGGDIRLSELSSSSLSGSPIESAGDLGCPGGCQWGNVAGDGLEWGQGTGRPDPAIWRQFMGTDRMPESPYHVLAANRAPGEEGHLVSDPIGCQLGGGTVTLKHWISQAEDGQPGAQLAVCHRKVGAARFDFCRDVGNNPSPGPSTVDLRGPIEGPFEIVIRGYDFLYNPGGIVVVDDVIYDAETVPGPCPDEEREETATRRTTARPSGNSGALADPQSCRKASCAFKRAGDPCGYNLKGAGSAGKGRSAGWRVINAEENRVNPLTGIRFDHERNRRGYFAVSDFADPRQTTIDRSTRYVLESEPVAFSDTYWLNFHYFLATEGIKFKMCRDAAGTDCFYEKEKLIRGRTDANSNREWAEEIIPIPAGDYKIYVISEYTGSAYNAGQVGLSYLKIYKDPNLLDPLCTV